jgi:amidohydrolase
MPQSSPASPDFEAEPFRRRSSELFEWTVGLRRRIHQQPELAFEEHETATLVAAVLRECGLDPREGLAGTGVVAEIVGERPGPSRALRADMDALPITEETGLPFASRVAGAMHACGHDAHTASLLATARILQTERHRLAGRVRVIFQPSEEKLPGGAPAMLRAGALAPAGDGPAPKIILGQHVYPDLPAGVIGIRAGPFMASSDEIYLTVRGEGGHAAHPHRLAADAVLVQAHILTALQSVISRYCPPEVPSILSFGKVTAAGATNIIPEAVHLEGTFRSMDEGWRFRAHDLIRRIATDTAAAMGASCEVRIEVGYPALVNDPAVAGRVRSAAVAYAGEEFVADVPPWYASEDFAYYTNAMSGAFYLLGVRNEKAGATHGLHTSRFTIDEEVLRTAPGFMAYLAWSLGED